MSKLIRNVAPLEVTIRLFLPPPELVCSAKHTPFEGAIRGKSFLGGSCKNRSDSIDNSLIKIKVLLHSKYQRRRWMDGWMDG